LYHHFRNDAFYDLYNLLKVRKTGKREVVVVQPLPQTLYTCQIRSTAGRRHLVLPLSDKLDALSVISSLLLSSLELSDAKVYEP